MQPLVLEYVFEGHQRGYTFTSPTQGYDEAALRTIWRRAMPRGQGWAAYTGARALKTFLLDDGRAALSEVTVTDLRDESGRGGIRRAVIQVMPPGAYLEYLRDRLARYAPPVRLAVEAWPTWRQRRQLLDRALPGKRAQAVIAYPYTTPDAWEAAEALAIKLALAPWLRGLGGRIVPFTTLALDYRDESPLVTLPADRARALPDAQAIAFGA
mgnify:CR=1 FL=1